MPIPPPPGPYLYERIDALLLAIAGELPRRPDWYERVAGLKRSAGPEVRVPVYQAVRDDGCLPDDAGFFLLSYTVEDIALDTQRLLHQVFEKDLERAPGSEDVDADDDLDDDLDEEEFDDEDDDLDDEEWDDDEFDDDELDEDELEEDELGPESRRPERPGDVFPTIMPMPGEPWDDFKLRVRQQSVKRHMFKNLAAYGEREMADVFAYHQDEFWDRHERGRRYFFQPEPSAAKLRAAVQQLYDHVRQCVGSRSPMGPLACEWSHDYGFIDLLVLPTPIELVGGPRDGAVVNPDVEFDLLRIQEAFDTIDGMVWTLDGEDRELQHCCVRGTYHGHDVWLTIFAGASADKKPTIKSDELRKWRAYRGGSAQ